MTSLQKKILVVVMWANIVINGAGLAACMWSDYQMEKQGVSVEAILAEGAR